MRVPGRTAETISAAPAGGADGSAAPAMSDDLKTVLGTGGAAGYRVGCETAMNRLHGDPHQSARVHFPAGAGRETRFEPEQVHGDTYMRGMHDHHLRDSAAPFQTDSSWEPR